MSKPIKLNGEYIDRIVNELRASLEKEKMFGGRLKFDKVFDDIRDDDRVSLVLSNVAYTKIISLIMCTDKEVAWHGVVTRDGNVFRVEDILVYPQVVTGVTVTADQEEYSKWLFDLDDEQFNKLRFHGHSHVNMGTSPSGTDNSLQEDILSQLKDDDYYIFFIGNKKLDSTIRIYDLLSNKLYEDKDIDVFIEDKEFDMGDFLDEASSLVKNHTQKYKGKLATGASYYFNDDI